MNNNKAVTKFLKFSDRHSYTFWYIDVSTPKKFPTNFFPPPDKRGRR